MEPASATKLRLKGPWRSLALLLGVGTVASLWSWASETWFADLTRVDFTEPTSGRPYRVVTRADHDARSPAPVLFALHAYATPPEVMLRGYPLEALAAGSRGVILVVPAGLRDAAGQPFWNASGACCGEGPDRPDDLGYLEGVLADVRRRYAVQRVAALGVSNGGFMAYRWACAGGGSLSAIASVSGAGPGQGDRPCSLSKPISVLQVHGDADEVIRYHGGSLRGATYPSARASLQPFLEAAGLRGAAERRTRNTWLFGSIEQQLWTGRDARVALWTVKGGSHHLRAAQACVSDILDFLLGE